jgi:DNA-binding PadR family transcriptional regulator
MSSIRFALLALLADEPAHGYALKQRFERLVGDVWPLNIGQVYDALSKLERDEMIEPAGSREGTRQTYRATDAGVDAAGSWLASPANGETPPRDELAIRLLVARVAAGGELGPILQAQRVAVVGRIQRLGREKASATTAGDDARVALLDLLLLRTDADARWLDLLEARFANQATLETS